MNGYVISVDPFEMSNRFASVEELSEDELEGEEIAEEAIPVSISSEYQDRIAPLLPLIPAKESDFIYLYYFCRKRQADIAEIFQVTQAAVSYRLSRGLKRLRFLLEVPTLSEEELHQDLPELFNEMDVNIMIGMWKTTCQSEVAGNLGLTQGRVRHRFFQAVKKLERVAKEERDRLGDDSEEEGKFQKYYKMFSTIADKRFNVLREVKLPQWQTHEGNICI